MRSAEIDVTRSGLPDRPPIASSALTTASPFAKNGTMGPPPGLAAAKFASPAPYSLRDAAPEHAVTPTRHSMPKAASRMEWRSLTGKPPPAEPVCDDELCCGDVFAGKANGFEDRRCRCGRRATRA